ncbi:hypothetical protein D9758_011168 [Tetrapyrgos nigripes]|uniref:RRM domain-containing protein n=1 Tax=Tetrapyrgos nigripes TaxID=182062 RepID=A0A8H5CJS3_9AGAR|nr:hypothetical protein D9758_011168 [Tetrapyrgos nigripes]
MLRSPSPSLLSTTTRFLLRRHNSHLAVVRQHGPLRSILVRNLPRKNIDPKTGRSMQERLFALKGMGRPIESTRIFRGRKGNLENDTDTYAIIHFLSPDSAKRVVALGANGRAKPQWLKKEEKEKGKEESVGGDGLYLNGRRLSFKLIPSHRLPVEVVAAVGLKSAVRRIIIFMDGGKGLAWTSQEKEKGRDISIEGLQKELALERFGELDSVYFDSEKCALMRFTHLMSATKALRTLRQEGWRVNYSNSASPRSIRPVDEPHCLRLAPVDSPLPKALRDLESRMDLDQNPWQDILRAHVYNGRLFLHFLKPAHAKAFYDTYEGPLRKSWDPQQTPPFGFQIHAVHLGASRVLCIDGFTNPGITFDQLHRDFSKLGEIYYVFADWQRACARVVFTNYTTALKAIEDIYENPEKYGIYVGARFTFGDISNLKRYSHLRPLKVMPPAVKLPRQVGEATETQALYDVLQSSAAENLVKLDEDDWLDAEGENVEYGINTRNVVWVEQRDDNGGCRFDVHAQ